MWRFPYSIRNYQKCSPVSHLPMPSGVLVTCGYISVNVVSVVSTLQV